LSKSGLGKTLDFHPTRKGYFLGDSEVKGDIERLETLVMNLRIFLETNKEWMSKKGVNTYLAYRYVKKALTCLEEEIDALEYKVLTGVDVYE
jgi:hypothetical protein